MPRLNIATLCRPVFVLALTLFIEAGTALAQPVIIEPVRDHVLLQLKWQHQFQFAGYYAAIEQGYYHEASLDVELLEAIAFKIKL